MEMRRSTFSMPLDLTISLDVNVGMEKIQAGRSGRDQKQKSFPEPAGPLSSGY